jgi:hypothetical protein
MASPVIDAINRYAHGWRLRLALATGAGLEGGTGSTYLPGDDGTSFGPFQIHLPAHPGVSAAEANNPNWAVRYMKGAYRSAVKKVPRSLWTTDPERAAETAAFLAERPAADYYSARGQAAVDAAYRNATTALGGKHNWAGTKSAGAGKTGGSTTGVDLGDVAGGVASTVGKTAEGAAALLSPLALFAKTYGNWAAGARRIVIEGALVIGGTALVAAGVYRSVTGQSVKQGAAEAKQKAGQAAMTAAEVAAL